MQPRISMISLAVDDLTRSVNFYRDGLSLPQAESPPGVAFFNLNGTWLGLAPRELLAEDIGISANGGGFSGVALAHNVVSEAEVDKVFEAALQAGAELVKPVQRAVWGGYHGYFKDPDGHLWEIAYNPFIWIGPRDQN